MQPMKDLLHGVPKKHIRYSVQMVRKGVTIRTDALNHKCQSLRRVFDLGVAEQDSNIAYGMAVKWPVGLYSIASLPLKGASSSCALTASRGTVPNRGCFPGSRKYRGDMTPESSSS